MTERPGRPARAVGVAGLGPAARNGWSLWRGAARLASRPSVGYFAGALAGAGCGALAFLALLATLAARGDLPAPAVANSVCVDEKLQFLRERAPPNPSLLVFGSSVAWRNFDGAPLFEATGGRTVALNLGFCGSQMSQTEFTAQYFLERYPSASALLLVIGLTDFEDCGRPAPFNAAHTDQYLDRALPGYAYYFRHFDPMSLMRNARWIAARRVDPATAEAMVIDRFGDGPSLMKRELFYDGRIGVDDRCLAALRRFASDLPAGIRDLAVVVSPIHPDWAASFDRSGEHLAAFVAQLRRAIAGTDAVLWDAHTALQLEESYFGDAIHLRIPGARRFSAYIVQRLARDFGGLSAGMTPERPQHERR